VCAGASKESFYCFKPCGKNISCKSNQECIKVGKETSICVTIKQLGESCDGHELCNDSLFCLIEDNTGNCRAPCGLVDPNGTGCEPGFNCKVFGLRQEICVPDMLSLTNSSALGFNDTQSTDKLSRYDKAPPSSQKSSACNSINLKDSNMSFLWALAALVFFRLLRTRARFL
jgi:hypothetical protein